MQRKFALFPWRKFEVNDQVALQISFIWYTANHSMVWDSAQFFSVTETTTFIEQIPLKRWWQICNNTNKLDLEVERLNFAGGSTVIHSKPCRVSWQRITEKVSANRFLPTPCLWELIGHFCRYFIGDLLKYSIDIRLITNSYRTLNSSFFFCTQETFEIAN